MSRYPSNPDHFKRRSGKGRRHGRGYGSNCWQQRNPNVYGYNHGYGDNRYEYDSHLPFQGPWIEEDVIRWLQSDNRSWTNQRMGNTWQHQNRMHHGANSFSSLHPVHYINSPGPSQNNCGTLKMNVVNESTRSENINDKPVSPAQQQPPPPGSEEARLKAVANTTDKLRQYLFSNRNKSTEVLQTLLSGSDRSENPNSMKESFKNANLDIPVPQPDLPPSPTDWQKICMSSRPKSPTNSEVVDDDVVYVAKPTAETVSIDSDDSISGDVSVISHKIKTEISVASLSSSKPITDIDSNKTCSNLQDSSGSSKEKPNNLSTDSAILRPVSVSSAESDNPVGSLKQNVVRQLLKMGSAGIKDIVNNPTSRKFQYALKHLVREHKVAWTRQLRILAETRIQNRNREIINHEHLLDPDIAVNISNLPQEFIEQLGDLLKMDLFDTVDFQETNTDDPEQGLRDLELLCSQVTQEAEKAFHTSRNSNQEKLDGQINSLQDNNINLAQNDALIVPNIKHERLDSDVHLNILNNTNQITKYSESSTSQKCEALDSEYPNLGKHAEGQIDPSGAKEIHLTSDSDQSPLNQFQPDETGESKIISLRVKDLDFNNVKQSNSLEIQNSGVSKNIETDYQSVFDKGFIINEIPSSGNTQILEEKEDCTQCSIGNSKAQDVSIDEGSCSQLPNEKIANEENGKIGIDNNTHCTYKALEITSQDYVKSNLTSVDNVLNVHSPILNETEISVPVEDSRDGNCKPEQTLGNVAHTSAGDSNAVKFGCSQETSDFQSVASSKRICTPAAKKCYNFNNLAVSVYTQTESSYRKFDVCEIISELEKVYHVPAHLIAVLKEFLEPKKTNVPKPQSERSVPSTMPLICVSKSLFNKLDSNETSNTNLASPHFEQRSLPRKSTALSDSCSDKVINEATSQVSDQSIHPDNLNIQMNPNGSNLQQKESVISSCTNISNDLLPVHENTYLKMLDIDSKIHQLMGMKIDLYKQLQLSFLSQKGNRLNSRTTSYGNTSNPQSENHRIYQGENSNIARECDGITPISDLDNPLISSAPISQTIPSHRISSVCESLPQVMEAITSDDTKKSDFEAGSSSHINKILEERRNLIFNSQSPKTSSIVKNNEVKECSIEPVVGKSNFSSSPQSLKDCNSRKKTKNKNKNVRNKKSPLKSISSFPGQNMPVCQTIFKETHTDTNIDNNDKSISPGTRKRAKISARELQSLGCLTNVENECSTVTVKTEVPDSDVEANNLGRTRRQRYSLLDENLLESQVFNIGTNMPNIDRKRKSISLCASEVIDNPYFKKIKSEPPYFPVKLRESENVHGTINMNSEEEQRVGCVYTDEFQQNDNANKSCKLPVSIASKAAVENNNLIIDNSIETANNEGRPSVSRERCTIIPSTNVTNIDALSETHCNLKSKEESEHSDANVYCPSTVKALSKIRNCIVLLERLPQNILPKADATACLKDRSEILATLSVEPMALENVPCVNDSKLFVNTDDRDEDTNSVSSVSGGGTPRRLYGPDDGGEAEARNHIKINQSLVGHKGPILDLQCIGRIVLAACEDGFVYCYSLKSGRLKRTLQCSKSAVTCICISDSASLGLKFIFCGSLDGYLRCFTFETGDAVNEPIYVGSGIQCIDHNWGNIYIGTKDGSVKIFNCKKFEILTNYFECSKESIFTIRTTKEGPRKVMLIGSRSSPVIVRDSATGLYLRSVTSESNFTVYSIVLDSSLVYCGTSIGTIPVYNFANGEEVCQFNAGAGVVSMKIYNDLLFAGCYDGFIYIFSIQDKNLITKVSGSGKMILSMEIAKNRIICSSKDKKLEVWNFPMEVRKYLKDTKHR